MAIGETWVRPPVLPECYPPGTLIRHTRLDEATWRYEELPPTAAQTELFDEEAREEAA